MASEVLVDEEVDVLVRVLSDANVQPTSFLWRNHTRYISDVGRQWTERVGGKSIRVYLVTAVDGNTYELYCDPAENRWTIHRAWLSDLVA